MLHLITEDTPLWPSVRWSLPWSSSASTWWSWTSSSKWYTGSGVWVFYVSYHMILQKAYTHTHTRNAYVHSCTMLHLLLPSFVQDFFRAVIGAGLYLITSLICVIGGAGDGARIAGGVSLSIMNSILKLFICLHMFYCSFWQPLTSVKDSVRL